MRDSQILPDVQLERDGRGIQLEEVGISRLEMPLQIHYPDGRIVETPAVWRAGVRLAAELKGTHMSRFVQALDEFSAEGLSDLNLAGLHEKLLGALHTSRLRLNVQFRYFIRKKAPVSGLSASAGYAVSLDSVWSESAEPATTTKLGLEILAANLCPCSKAISEQGAHNQRVVIRVELDLADPQGWDLPRLEELIRSLEASGSSELFPLLKRGDEKFVTEQQFANPKFAEDVARDAILSLRKSPGLAGFTIEVEALESIHSHNALVRHAERLG